MFTLFIDSYNSVSFDVEYDFRNDTKQIKSEHQSRSGRRFTYKWGEVGGRSFSVRFVSSSTAAIVNSWWSSNVSLRLQEEGTLDVFSCTLVSDTPPIGRFEKPYNDLYRGKIELEGY